MKLSRAYSTLQLKAASDDGGKRRFTGIASTIGTDRMGDIVEPGGAQFKLPLPFLWQHNSREPIGWITAARVTKTSIEVDGEVADVAEDGPLKQRLAEAWQMLKAGLVRGLSIGFNAIESARIEGTFGLRFLKWEWLELSAVTIAANADSSIQAIKHIDAEFRRAASGAARVVHLGASPIHLPGASGSTSKAPEVKTIQEQIAEFETRRKSAGERMDTIMAKAGDEGRTLDESESEEYDNLGADLKSIDAHIARLKAHESLNVANATRVTQAAGVDETAATTQRAAGGGNGGGGVVLSRRNVDKGIAFTRYAIALARAKGNIMHAAEIAKQWDESTPEVGLFIKEIVRYGSVDRLVKTAVAAGTTSDATWAGPLVYAQNMVSEFIEFLRPRTILGRLPGLRRVPFNIRIPRQTAGTSGTFVGEGAPKPVQKASFDSITLTWAKAATIAVLTEELVRMSNPSAEALVRQDLADGIAAYLDRRFIDPSYAGVANVSPASVTNGVTSRQASGATLAAIDADVGYVLQQMVNAELTLTSGIWIMSPGLAITLSLMRNAQGDFAFPGLNMNGGTWYGLPVITSNSVGSSGSPGESQIVLLDQNEILLADDGQMLLDMSTEASVQMNDAPSAGAQALVSLWQNDLVGVKVERWINWAKRRSAAVQVIEAAQRYAS